MPHVGEGAVIVWRHKTNNINTFFSIRNFVKMSESYVIAWIDIKIFWSVYLWKSKQEMEVRKSLQPTR